MAAYMSASKKCAEIAVSWKKNGKKVFTISCWFCDTVYPQMRKFTLHLEDSHGALLDLSNRQIIHVEEEEDTVTGGRSANDEEPNIIVETMDETDLNVESDDPLDTHSDKGPILATAASKICRNDDIRSKLKSLSHKEICALIDIYKKHKCLWNVNDMCYGIKTKRHEALQGMVQQIKNDMKITLSIQNLRKHLQHLHNAYASDKHRHLQSNISNEKFVPKHKFFRNCDFLYEHQGPFCCRQCNEIIETYEDYQIHKAAHSGSLPFSCPDCGMGFKKLSYYNVHVKRHLGIFKFHCTTCGKGYPFSCELAEHMRSHTGAQPYLCSICGESFGRLSTYDNHIRRHEQRFRYLCEICQKGFNCLVRLKEHVKAHLNVRDVVCSECGKTFTSRRYLGQHKKMHASQTSVCNICGKSFASPMGLRSHKKYHKNRQEPYK